MSCLGKHPQKGPPSHALENPHLTVLGEQSTESPCAGPPSATSQAWRCPQGIPESWETECRMSMRRGLGEQALCAHEGEPVGPLAASFDRSPPPPSFSLLTARAW